MRRAATLFAAPLVVLGALYAFQRPFREYPGVEYDDFDRATEIGYTESWYLIGDDTGQDQDGELEHERTGVHEALVAGEHHAAEAGDAGADGERPELELDRAYPHDLGGSGMMASQQRLDEGG